MTRTSRFDFGSGPNPDPTYLWDIKHKLLSLVEVCALPSAVLVNHVKYTDLCWSPCPACYICTSSSMSLILKYIIQTQAKRYRVLHLSAKVSRRWVPKCESRPTCTQSGHDHLQSPGHRCKCLSISTWSITTVCMFVALSYTLFTATNYQTITV